MSAIIPYLQPGAITNAQSDITDLQALSGMPDNSLNLGTFTGTTIPDSQTTKQALQALETEVEDRLPDFVQWRVGTGPGYYFDGVNDQVLTPVIATLGSETIVLNIEIQDTQTLQRIIHHTAGAADRTYLEISSGVMRSNLPTGGVGAQFAISTGKQNIIYVRDDATETFYLNGEEVASGAVSGFVSSGSDEVYIGRSSGGSVPFKGVISNVQILNRAVTEAEAQLLSRGQSLGYADEGADPTQLTSGTLVVGKRYRITDFQSGDDFTNIGAGSNANGVEFVATGTTPTTWTNSSGVTPIGEVLRLTGNGAAPTIWADESGNGYNSTVTGATLIYQRALHADSFVSFTNLPTSSAGLATGQVWNDSGTLKIV